MIISYDEALTIAQKQLKSKVNLRHFCAQLGINYNCALRIKNGNAIKPYPEIIIKILENIGYSVKKLIYYKIDKRYGNPRDKKER